MGTTAFEISRLRSLVKVFIFCSFVLAGCSRTMGPPTVVPDVTAGEAVVRGSSGYRVLHSFGGKRDGYNPSGTLIDVKGTFFGTTRNGGTNSCSPCGTLYSINAATGKEHVLHSFGGKNDGYYPNGGLVDVGGMLYGTTSGGGTLAGDAGGTVFSVSTTGTGYNLLHSFDGLTEDGGTPASGLVYVNGTLYGTTLGGGRYAKGIVFSISRAGTERVLHSFGAKNDGNTPQASLTYVNGTFYGTTQFGGKNPGCSCGTVFSISPTGQERVLYSFKGGKDGNEPFAGLIDVKGVLYGTTVAGGTDSIGTVFSVSATGVEHVLHTFTGSDGSQPYGGLIDVNDTLYGTAGGGTTEGGVIFSITTTGAERVVWTFQGGAQGYDPESLIALKGTLYGTTVVGGAYDLNFVGNGGTVFALGLL